MMTPLLLEMLCRRNEGSGVIARLDAVAGSSQFESRTSNGTSDFKRRRTGREQLHVEQFPDQANRKRGRGDDRVNRQGGMTKIPLSPVMQEKILTEKLR
jgi:hypothetical protein